MFIIAVKISLCNFSRIKESQISLYSVQLAVKAKRYLRPFITKKIIYQNDMATWELKSVIVTKTPSILPCYKPNVILYFANVYFSLFWYKKATTNFRVKRGNKDMVAVANRTICWPWVIKNTLTSIHIYAPYLRTTTGQGIQSNWLLVTLHDYSEW